jgi:hypothetical protein
VSFSNNSHQTLVVSIMVAIFSCLDSNYCCMQSSLNTTCDETLLTLPGQVSFPLEGTVFSNGTDWNGPSCLNLVSLSHSQTCNSSGSDTFWTGFNNETVYMLKLSFFPVFGSSVLSVLSILKRNRFAATVTSTILRWLAEFLILKIPLSFEYLQN